MRTQQRVAAILVAVAMAAAACGGSDDDADTASDTEENDDTGSSDEGSEPTSSYPEGPIELIVPWAAGAGIDAAARVVAADASEHFGVPVNVVNIDQASGVGGTIEALNAEPDGYTMLFDGSSTSSLLDATRGADVPFALDERTYVAKLISDPVFFATCTGSGYDGLDAAVEAAASGPADFAWGAGGFGSTVMLSQADFLVANGVDVAATRPVVSETGITGTRQDCVAGDVAFAFTLAADFAALTETGGAEVQAVATEDRVDIAPDIPSVTELGLEPGTITSTWYGLSGPEGLPDDVVAAWEGLFESLGEDTEFQDEVSGSLLKVWDYLAGQEFEDFVLQESESASGLVESLGLQGG
jgi:tripartite-type tricarboxylate transporter receptor subunit TctC